MKTARIHQYGDINDIVIEEISIPKVALTQVLVHVEASAVNPLDVKLAQGAIQE